MSIREYRFLLSERTALQKLMERTRPESVITLMSLKHRLGKVEEEVAACEERLSTQPSEVRLTFRGKPVVGSHGIGADFGPHALEAFATRRGLCWGQSTFDARWARCGPKPRKIWTNYH